MRHIYYMIPRPVPAEAARIRERFERLLAAGITVANSGSVIAAEDFRHLFEPFYRADTARTRADEGGTGLGLAMVVAIAQLHHARLGRTRRRCALRGRTGRIA